jgi:hypothetical protein
MTGPERRVRQLRLRARGTEDVRHLMPVLEDALRCASLPDAGGRVLLVRRLALGRLSGTLSSQALAELIEQRFSATTPVWAEGGTAAAATAAHVAFAGALQARTLLSVRLARGEDCSAWYWPLAVPEWRGASGAADALRRMASTMAGWPECRQALSAWGAALIRAGQAQALMDAIDAEAGRQLLLQAGLSDLAVTAGDGSGEPPAPACPPASWRTADKGDGPPQTLPRPRVHPLKPPEAEGPHRVAPAAVTSTQARAKACKADPPEPRPAHTRPAVSGPAGHEPENQDGRSGPDRRSRSSPAPSPPRALAQGPALAGSTAASGPAAASVKAEPAVTPSISEWASGFAIAGAPTTQGGLLFLLPVLARLGLGHWPPPAGDAGFTRRVLRQALQRLRVEPDDVIWALVDASAPVAAWPEQAPAGWADPLLRTTGHGRSPDVALAAGTDADAQAGVWLDAARRWLRRRGGIGLASLVARPARLHLTATHVDVHFCLRDADMRVRRAGLDVDPGWLPWFGRVVNFHFDREQT